VSAENATCDLLVKILALAIDSATPDFLKDSINLAIRRGVFRHFFHCTAKICHICISGLFDL